MFLFKINNHLFFSFKTSDYKESFELSPETLKKKYKTELSASLTNRSIEKTSGSKNRMLSPQNKSKTDYTLLLGNELSKHSNFFKAQNDYLKMIIYSLDMKLKVKH